MPSKKTNTVGFNKPLGGDAVVQLPGGQEFSVKAVREKCMKAVSEDPELQEAKAKVNSMDVYLKPEEGKAYYVAKTADGEATGCVDLAG